MIRNSIRGHAGKNKWRARSALLAAAAVVVPTGVQAQLDEIVVTSTKREASIQDVPASISQISGDALEARGVSNIENLALQIPNLTFGSNGSNAFISLRGIGTTVDSGVAEPAVSTYVDGVFLPRASMSVLRQVDLERVEVLRGPQGTLYGRNATGGAINFISRSPSDEMEGGLTLYGENRSGYGISGYLSGPITDKVSIRFSGGRERQDGYVEVLNTDEELADTDVTYGRVALRVEPTSDLTIDVSVQHEDSESQNGYQALFTAVPGVPPAFLTTEENKLIADGPHAGDVVTTIVSGRINWDLSDSVSLRSITGYVDHSVNTTFDADGTSAIVIDLVDAFRPSESFSQEINLYGETDWLSWLVGGYFFKEDFFISLPVNFGGFLVNAGDLKEETTSYALFTDLTVSVTDRFRINGGLRFNSEEKDFEFFHLPSPAGDLNSDDVLPKVGLQFDVTEDINIYGQWQKGIKSGGHQISLPSTFASEEIQAYEIGVKSQFLDGQLTANASGFFYDYTDLQATTVIPPSTTLVQNGDAEVFGLEAEISYTLTDNVAFNFGASFLDSEYTSLFSDDQTTPVSVLVDLSGEELIRAPSYTLNFGAEWFIPVDHGILEGVRLRADVFHSDDFKLNFFDYAETRQESYTTANLSAIFTDTSGRYQLRAYVNNVGNTVTKNQANFLATTGAFFGTRSEPRNGGVSLMAKF